jgi:serine/threonine protein phosphatase PrpC
LLDSIGCTANVILIDDYKKLYVANAGDSRCVLGRAGKAVALSFDHKPENEEERARIENAGSTITDGRVDGNLNLSRSLGDLKYK